MNTKDQASSPAPSINKEWGRAISGGLTILGSAGLASMALGRVLEAAGADTLPSKEQLALAFFYVFAAASVAIMRGFVSIGPGAGMKRTPVSLLGLAVIIVILIVVAAIMNPAAPPFPFWIALSLPVIGSFVEDRLVSK